MSTAAPVVSLESQSVKLAELTTLANLLETHRDRMIAMIERRTDDKVRSRRCAFDVYQEACAKAHRRWSEFPKAGMSDSSWLYRIVLDCLMDDRDFHIAEKRDVRAETLYPDRSSLQFTANVFDHNPGPQTQAQRREEAEVRHKRVAQILMLLDPSEREVLCMRFYDDLKHPEIAEILNSRGMRLGNDSLAPWSNFTSHGSSTSGHPIANHDQVFVD